MKGLHSCHNLNQVNPLPHATNLQQMTLTRQKYEKSLYLKVLSSKRVENIVAKDNEQFLLLSQCFQKSSDADALKYVLKWEGVNPFPHIDAF